MDNPWHPRIVQTALASLWWKVGQGFGPEERPHHWHPKVGESFVVHAKRGGVVGMIAQGREQAWQSAPTAATHTCAARSAAFYWGRTSSSATATSKIVTKVFTKLRMSHLLWKPRLHSHLLLIPEDLINPICIDRCNTNCPNKKDRHHFCSIIQRSG